MANRYLWADRATGEYGFASATDLRRMLAAGRLAVVAMDFHRCAAMLRDALGPDESEVFDVDEIAHISALGTRASVNWWVREGILPPANDKRKRGITRRWSYRWAIWAGVFGTLQRAGVPAKTLAAMSADIQAAEKSARSGKAKELVSV